MNCAGCKLATGITASFLGGVEIGLDWAGFDSIEADEWVWKDHGDSQPQQP